MSDLLNQVELIKSHERCSSRRSLQRNGSTIENAYQPKQTRGNKKLSIIAKHQMNCHTGR